jgi:hypothetical protein
MGSRDHPRAIRCRIARPENGKSATGSHSHRPADPPQGSFVINYANDINDRGQIVAQGYKMSSPTDYFALLLKPTRSAK